MNVDEPLKHTTWECKYHGVFIPKYRRKTLSGQIRRELGQVFHDLAGQKECEIVEAHRMIDHAHRLVSIPPKYAGSQVMGFIKGKSAIHIARGYAGRRRNFVGQHFWARGYWGSTVGKNEAAVRRSIQEQEKEDQRLDQLEMFGALSASRSQSTALSGSRYLKPPALPESLTARAWRRRQCRC